MPRKISTTRKPPKGWSIPASVKQAIPGIIGGNGVHVPPQWPRATPTKIAFIAEAPSDEEIEHGIPLIGPSGRVFNSILRTAGLDRADYLVTNVFDQKLPDNNVAAWCVPLTEAREKAWTDLPPIGAAGFLRPEYRWHLDRLKKELEISRPNVVVPLGGTALWALTGMTSITATRGHVIPATRLVPGAKLVPTFHPAAVIRAWNLFSVVTGDFMTAHTQALIGPKIVTPSRRLLLEPTLDDIRAIKSRLLQSPLLSVDIETGWGQITCIGFAPDKETAICIPFLDKRTSTRNYWATAGDERAAWQEVREVMESETPKLGQNFGGYDAYWLLEKMHIQPRAFLHDTRLLHHALYPELPKSLAFMGASYSTQGMWKQWGKAHKEKRDDQ